MDQMKTLKELREQAEREAQPDPSMKAYSCRIKSLSIEFIVAARNCEAAKDEVIHKGNLADKALTRGQIHCRRRPQFDELAQKPRATRMAWWLGYRWDGELGPLKVGCLYDQEV